MCEPIDRDALRAELAGPEPPVLVEALGAAFYDDAHLPGAHNIPPGQVDRLASVVIPDRGSRVVVYGSGDSQSSRVVADRLGDLGYRAVLIYLGGKEDWVEHQLPVDRSGPDTGQLPETSRPAG